jgi:hypothetical protein
MTAIIIIIIMMHGINIKLTKALLSFKIPTLDLLIAVLRRRLSITALVEMILQGKPNEFGENHVSATCTPQTSHERGGGGANMGLRGYRPATNRLCDGTVSGA